MTGLKLNEDWKQLTTNERRDKLLTLESVCKEMPQVEIPVVEYFCDGIYAREISAPAGATLVGEIHLKPQLNVVSKGKIRVATEDGIKTITAPATFISPAGVKRAGFVLEDVVWTTFHATTLDNESDIRKEFIAPNYETLDKVIGETNVVDSNSSNSCGNNLPDKRSKEVSKESETTSSGR